LLSNDLLRGLTTSIDFAFTFESPLARAVWNLPKDCPNLRADSLCKKSCHDSQKFNFRLIPPPF
jgi:hypothetical protein